ncbi:Dolichyl-phosphate-mannose-protein mannosyltransferase [Tenacibaculum sp. MAR_2009_124]|uniref:ArnT family glycosyltransferase n=1 Tax=Tenacibaculum sp. MAR_2009_124 TaxID=1250059 RepID=UPI000894FC1F|nr:glycosyltransferase family 39 protein [Tenacibaculum sp. MAR_2009_124]SEB37265.1 Dolichyl-phosphate-mannose-protein mannosyltransferase [Tenacibaculum sp. MAR_2009_124]
MNLGYKQSAFILIIISTLVRIFLASQLEFGNDEVYYWLYAKYPGLSHFDHPPFVGFFIQFFTFNLFFKNELVIRLAAIIPASVSMYLVFLIGSYIRDYKTGFISVLLYNISIYGFIISGLFILPDAPLLLFWLLSFYFLIQALPKVPSNNSRLKLFLGFFFIGCAIYSKYQAIFLLFGVALYVVFINRDWLKDWSLYVSLLLPVVFILLIVLWNYNNDFISYTFHNDRVSLVSLKFNRHSFLRELLGQVLYNNPYVYVMIIVMFIGIIRKKFTIHREFLWMFLLFSLPLIFVTLYVSLYRDTLPHWSGLSYITILPLLAVFLERKEGIERKLKIGFVCFTALCILASFWVNYGWFSPKVENINKEAYGRNNAVLDMYGWKQASKKVTNFLIKEKLNNLPIVSDKWFPAAHIDYYIARRNNMNVYGVGELTDIHKYYWVNKELPTIENKKEYLYITDSRNFRNPEDVYINKYQEYKLLQVFPINRGGQVVKNVFLYLLTKD